MGNLYRLTSASLSENELIFSSTEERKRALSDGCFCLQIPHRMDIKPGIELAMSFYLPKETDTIPAPKSYCGFKENSKVFFPRKGYQTEHILIDQHGRETFFPKEVNVMCEAMHNIARKILIYILTYVGIDQKLWSIVTDDISDNINSGVKWFAANHYRCEIDSLGAPEHKDTGFITVLYCEEPGLEVYLNRQWLEVEIIKNHFIINFGGALELLTQRLSIPISAVLHRVKKCEKRTSGEERFSFAEFINPSANAMLYQVSKCGRQANKIISVEKFLETFNSTTWSDDYRDFGILK